MPRAYAPSNASSIRHMQCTDGRTDGLTENHLTQVHIFPFRNAHARTKNATKWSEGDAPDGLSKTDREIWVARAILATKETA